MIYTVTLNPSIDYVVFLDRLCQGEINRSAHEEIHFGGKGINVSVILSRLGIPSTALGFLAGFTGRAIEDALIKENIKTDFVHTKEGFSRINLKLEAENETQINANGPDICENKILELFQKIGQIKKGDTLVLSGSVPKSLPQDIYKQILELIDTKNVKIIVDAEKDLLLQTLDFSPYMVKPNITELGDIFGVEIKTAVDSLIYAKKLADMGAQNVLVSMGEEGAVLLDDSGMVHFCPACSGKVLSTVGSGDSMVAGFLAGIEDNDYEYALLLACAAGSATAFSAGLAGREEIYAALELLK